MTEESASRRTFLTGSTVMAATVYASQASPADVSGAHGFVAAWDTAWANQDAQALGALHTENAITVNRFGTLLEGRESIQKALAFLHQNNGPFSHSTSPPQKILLVRQIAPDVMTVHTKWQSPVMDPDGKIEHVRTDDMIVTFVISKTEAGWKATDVDLHNVEKMDLPFSNPSQRD